jgi:hypothetical protein
MDRPLGEALEDLVRFSHLDGPLVIGVDVVHQVLAGSLGASPELLATLALAPLVAPLEAKVVAVLDVVGVLRALGVSLGEGARAFFSCRLFGRGCLSGVRDPGRALGPRSSPLRSTLGILVLGDARLAPAPTRELPSPCLSPSLRS